MPKFVHLLPDDCPDLSQGPTVHTSPHIAHVLAWLAYLAAGDLSPGTINLRKTYFSKLLQVLPDPLLATERDLVGFMNNSRWGTEAKRSALATLRSFYGWAFRTGLIESNPTEFLHKIKPKQRIPKPINEIDLKRALLASTREQEFMLLLGAYSGLRRSEIAAVHSDDISDMGLTVKGKGGRTRRVPIHPRLAPHLRGLHGWAFPSPRNPGEHVVSTYVRDRLGDVLPYPWTPHSLRHRFATATFRACKDILIVQQLLGHSKVETTLLYVLVEQDSLTNAVLAVA